MSEASQAFSRRLAEAMQAKGYEPRPGRLHKLFNSRYTGRSVEFSSASKWLNGTNIPVQTKLVVLAELFDVDPNWLRFGGAAKGSRIAEAQPAYPPGTSPQERDVIKAFLALPAPRRKLVGELIKELAGR